MKDFTCPRRFYHSHYQGLEPIEKALPLDMGSCADGLLQLIHGGEGISAKTFIDYFEPLMDDREELRPWQYAMWGLFEGYVERGYGDMKGECQVPFTWFLDGYPRIKGYADLVLTHEYHIGYEFKYTSRVESYNKFTVSQQLGCYFLGLPDLQRITLRAIAVPQLKQGKNESGADYRDRVKADFLARPGHYINDANYWRSEFDLEAVKERARRIAQSIHSFANEGINGFYQVIGPETCFTPSRCNYLSICESGVVSETIYKCREKTEDRR